MAPTATPQTIVISPDSRLITIQHAPKLTKMEVPLTTPSLPKYAVGLFDSVGQGPRKRKRLTHLTQEEKVMRRKLKNRVAAQTARDRKKIRMESLEETINKVQQQAKQLLDVNLRLLERTEHLEQENTDLKKRLGLAFDNSSSIPQNRLEVERIKIEMDETVTQSDQMLTVPVPDSMLSPDESADENEHHGSLKRKVFDFQCLNDAKRQCLTAVERASSEPAAGRCQADADPLNGSDPSAVFAPSNTETRRPSKDLQRLLKDISADFDQDSFQDLTNSSTDRCIGSDRLIESIHEPVTREQLDSIKELINVDHIYSKPAEVPPTVRQLKVAKAPAVRVQLSRSSRLTKLIRQHSGSPPNEQPKPAALCEKSSHSLDLTKNSAAALERSGRIEAAELINPQPMLCPVKVESDLYMDDSSEASSVLDLDNLDAELDLLLNQTSATPGGFQGIEMPQEQHHVPAVSDLTSMLETPTTLGEEFSFENLDYCSSMDNSDPTSSELFPQLASFML